MSLKITKSKPVAVKKPDIKNYLQNIKSENYIKLSNKKVVQHIQVFNSPTVLTQHIHIKISDN